MKEFNKVTGDVPYSKKSGSEYFSTDFLGHLSRAKSLIIAWQKSVEKSDKNPKGLSDTTIVDFDKDKVRVNLTNLALLEVHMKSLGKSDKRLVSHFITSLKNVIGKGRNNSNKIVETIPETFKL